MPKDSVIPATRANIETGNQKLTRAFCRSGGEKAGPMTIDHMSEVIEYARPQTVRVMPMIGKKIKLYIKLVNGGLIPVHCILKHGLIAMICRNI